MLRTNVVEPVVRDYDNLWDGTVDTNFWSTASGVVESRGTVSITSTDAGAFSTRTTKDIRVYKRICVSAALATLSWAKSNNPAQYAACNAYIALTDGASVTKIFDLTTTAYIIASAANYLLGFITLTTEGTKVRVRTAGVSANDHTGTTSHSETILADNTLVDTSAWANVYLQISAYASSLSDVGYPQASILISGLEITQYALGSQGTV